MAKYWFLCQSSLLRVGRVNKKINYFLGFQLYTVQCTVPVQVFVTGI